MYDFIDVVDNHPFRYRRVAIAVVASICLHAIIFGILGQQLLLGITESPYIRSNKITLQIMPTKGADTEPTAQEPPVSAQPPARERRENKDTATRRIPSVSSQQILSTAREASLQAAIRHPDSDLEKPPTIESKLSEALNPKREPAGVSTLTDGTTRVVTDWGLVYCIPPEDEYRILGPEDNLPISMTCH